MKLKALVIDDSRVMRCMVMDNLRRAGLAEFEFVEAADGAEALAKFDSEEFDIAFVDWNMPTMTGIEFVRAVRAKDTGPETPLVMITSEKTMGKMSEALDRAGATEYVSKPFTSEELSHKLANLFEEIKTRRQASQRRGFFSSLLS